MALHQSEEIIAQQYRILKTLGRGGVGITYEAIDLESSQLVVLKVLSLRGMKDWKALELFEREASILSRLNHPAIPRYIGYFQIDYPGDRCFYIVQQLATGKSLAALVEKGWKPHEADVRDLAAQILEILVYLQEFIPPVIHRDIKPQNIIRSDSGKLFMVDFGAVRDRYHNTVTGGSTVVGTFGYMAPEQFRGQAILSTDLYGLGTTLLFLLTGKSPADFPQRKLKIKFRSRVRVSQEFAFWLERMIEPAAEDRWQSAKDALAALRGEQTLANSLTQRLHKPRYSPITLTRIEERLVVDIPPVWLRSKSSRLLGLLSLIITGVSFLSVLGLVALIYAYISGRGINYAFNLHWSIRFLLFWPFQVIVSPLAWLLNYTFITLGWLLNHLFIHSFIRVALYYIGAFISFAIWFSCVLYFPKALWDLGRFAIAAGSRIKLEINQNEFRLQRSFLGLLNWKFHRRTREIEEIELQEIKRLKNSKSYRLSNTFCAVKSKSGDRDISGLVKTQIDSFGFFLTRAEKEWLVGEIRAFLEESPTSKLQVKSRSCRSEF